MIVVDASVVVDVLVGEGRALERMSADELAAPHLLDADVCSVVRRMTLARLIGAADGRRALDDLAAVEILRFEHAGLLARAFELRDNLSAYDGMYVALAEALDAPLLTLDARIAAAPGLRATVEVVGA